MEWGKADNLIQMSQMKLERGGGDAIKIVLKTMIVAC